MYATYYATSFTTSPKTHSKALHPNYNRQAATSTATNHTQILPAPLRFETQPPTIMPSRSNPNTPTSLKPKSARTLKSKRQQTQRLANNKITKPTTPRTSQAIRKAAPLSRKKARKVEKKIGYAKKRAMEDAGEVEMKDVAEVDGKLGKSGKVVREGKGGGDADVEMEGVE